VKRIGMPWIPLLAVIALLLGVAFWKPHGLTHDPVVILVGDFTSQPSLALPIGSAIRRLDNANSPHVFRIVEIDVADPEFRPSSDGQALTSTMRTKLLQAIATDNVIGIISANTTMTAPTVIDVGASFHIPVLLTIATNDRLLADRPGNTALRLVPRDDLQATAIANWCNDKSTGGLVHIIHDSSQYGLDLKTKIVTSLTCRFVTTELVSGSDVAGVLQRDKDIHVSAYVVIGYPAQADDFVRWRTELSLKTPTLFSDGCIGHWLTDIRPNDDTLFVAFPDTTGRSTQQGHQLGMAGNGIAQDSKAHFRSYEVFGEDAYHLLSMVVSRSQAIGIGKFALYDALATDPALVAQTETALEYHFQTDGENMTAKFRVYEVQNVVPR
jgi:hypothetical protein